MFKDVRVKFLESGKFLVRTVELNPLSAFRIAFALYFVGMNVTMLLSARFLLGEESAPKELFLDYYRIALLNWIFAWPDEVFICAMILSIFAGLYFAVGRKKRIAALVCWILMALIFIRLPVSRSIHIPFLGFTLLLNLFIPDPKSNGKVQLLSRDFATREVAVAAWILILANYVAAALFKLRAPEWQSGDALYYLFSDIMPRKNQLTAFLLESPIILKFATYSVLAIEGLSWCLIFSQRMRMLFIVLSAAFHIAILISFRMEALTLGMLVFHVFLLAVTIQPASALSENRTR